MGHGRNLPAQLQRAALGNACLRTFPDFARIAVARIDGRVQLLRRGLTPAQADGNRLSRIDQRRKRRVVAVVVEVIGMEIGALADAERLRRRKAVDPHLQRIAAVDAASLEAGNVLALRAEAAGGAGQREGVAPLAGVQRLRPALGHGLAGHAIGQIGQISRAPRRVHGVQAAQHRRHREEVVDRRAPLFVIDGLQPAEHAHDRADVAHVAVRVPAAHVADVQRAVEIAAAADHREHHHRRVGDDVAGSRIAVVAPMAAHMLERRAPVGGIRFADGAHVPGHPGVFAVGGNAGKRRVENFAHALCGKRRGNGRRDELPAVNSVAAMAHRRGLSGVFRRKLRPSGQHEAPGVDENLTADLLGDGRAVLGDGAGARRGNARAQVQIGRVLGGLAVAAPPVKAVLIGRVVQPRLRNLVRREVAGISRVVQRADEQHRPVGVVVRGEQVVIHHIAVQLAVHLPNLVVCPALDGRAVAHADELAQPSGIAALNIVPGHLEQIASLLCNSSMAAAPASKARGRPPAL